MGLLSGGRAADGRLVFSCMSSLGVETVSFEGEQKAMRFNREPCKSGSHE